MVYLTSPDGGFSLIPNILVAVAAALVLFLGVYRRRNQSETVKDTAILLGYFTEGAELRHLAEGSLGDMHYMVIMPTSGAARVPFDNGALLYRVELPFRTKVHLLSIPKKTGATQLNPGHSGLMEPVVLEGNFDDYFSLFCEKGMQTDARYVLDPEAMDFLVKFGQAFSWELVANELYFGVEAGVYDPNDHTDMFKDIAAFVSRIRPAVEQPLSAAEVQAMTPYGEDRRTDLTCPICKCILKNTGSCFTCPEGHGALVSGRYLRQVVQTPRHINVAANPKPDAATFMCPSCGTPMIPVAYEFSETTIHSCPNCPYRWVDAADVADASTAAEPALR